MRLSDNDLIKKLLTSNRITFNQIFVRKSLKTDMLLSIFLGFLLQTLKITLFEGI